MQQKHNIVDEAKLCELEVQDREIHNKGLTTSNSICKLRGKEHDTREQCMDDNQCHQQDKSDGCSKEHVTKSPSSISSQPAPTTEDPKSSVDDARSGTEIGKNLSNGPFLCSTCGKSFQVKSYLKRHVLMHSEERHFHCFCGRHYKRKDHLKFHMQKKHNIVDEAKLSELEVDNRKSHQRWTKLDLTCKICGKVYDTRRQWRDHYCHRKKLHVDCSNASKSPSKDKTYTNKTFWKKSDLTCKHCGKVFLTRMKFNDHKQIHRTERPFLCSICGKSFRHESSLKVHMVSHKDERPHHCFCGRRYKRKCGLRDHIQSKHSHSKALLCHLCGRSCPNKSSLRAHLNIHSGLKPFKCQFCPRAFTGAFKLKEHIPVHTGEKPYKCDTCEKRFPSRSCLRKHTHLHTGEKPYRCWVCGNKFSRSTTLKNHIRIHTGEKPHECDICKKRFTQHGALYLHKKNQHGVKGT